MGVDQVVPPSQTARRLGQEGGVGVGGGGGGRRGGGGGQGGRGREGWLRGRGRVEDYNRGLMQQRGGVGILIVWVKLG